MGRPTYLGHIIAANFIVRSAYQMGKTPLLPILAASLGATDQFLGLIVSVSTVTGMVSKPLVGVLADRWGRRAWLLVGTCFFIGVPFLYRFVETPGELLGLRLVHGLATAIYGPVSLAWVAARVRRRAEGIGWYVAGRNAGYIVGPAAAGWLLMHIGPVDVFTLIGLLSAAALVPVLMLQEGDERRCHQGQSLLEQLRTSLKAGASTPALWLAGSLEALSFVGLYAIKAFLPLQALASGVSVGLVGLFFSLQEGVHLLLQPLGGRLGDRWGYSRAIAAGLLVLSAGLGLLPWALQTWALLGTALLLGAGQALVFPATVALVSVRLDKGHLGAGMGLLGTAKNAGKVAGPVVGGVLLIWFDYARMLHYMGALLAGGALLAARWGYWGRGADHGGKEDSSGTVGPTQ